MGNWFSNLHVRKSISITENDIVENISKMMIAQHYLPTTSPSEADGSFAIITDIKSQWYSVYSDLFSFDKPTLFADYAIPLSTEMKTEVLGISCFDSDYLYLNLIDVENKVDAWVGVGSAVGLGFRKRSNLSAWKNKVSDFIGFKESVKKKYVFSEEVLADVEHCIHLPHEYGMLSYEHLSDLESDEEPVYLYFKLPVEMKSQDAPKFFQRTFSLNPCFLDRPSVVSGINIGGASKGLSVYFIGPYVEYEEITFSDVSFVKNKGDCYEYVPFDLEKVQLSDGQWAYYYHDPAYRIPPKVDDNLPVIKQRRIESERSIKVRFIPHGNPRKVLDITVALVPDKNIQGQTVWNVWHRFGSKSAYIEERNKTWRKHPDCSDMILNEEDYD